MSQLKKLTSGLAFRLISMILLILFIFGFIVLYVGYHSFVSSYTRAYNDAAYHTAQTALGVINPDKIDDYLACNGDDDSYRMSFQILNRICQTQDVTFIYLIKVEDDYNHFLSVFNLVNEDSDFAPWEIGYRRETTNNQYRTFYKDIYENGLDQAYIVRTDNLSNIEPHITTLVPAIGSDGTVKGIMCVQRPMEELASGLRKFHTTILLSTFLFGILVFGVAFHVILRDFIHPLKRITEEAERFAKENTATENGNLLNQAGSISEIQKLAWSIQTMEKENLSYVKHLTNITAERQRISTELSLAQKIQDNSLSKVFPDTDLFTLFASMDPAKEVGGDFYDFFYIDENHLCLVIADVSGKGIPASLFMMMSKILVKNYASQGGSPGKILCNLNNHICTNSTTDMFVTVWIGIMDIHTGHVIASNGGHERPILQNPDGTFELFKDKHGFVIGGLPDMKYTDYEFNIEKGCTLFVYTDGLPEATNKEQELFGVPRVLDVLNSGPSKSPKEIISRMNQAVSDFVGEASQFDDLTMLVIMRK